MKDGDYKEPNDKSTEMNTSSAIINKLTMKGYTENFKATAKGLYAPSNEKCYSPEEVAITNFYRFEGSSDPADNTILYSLKTTDGLKGTLIDSYGAYGDKNVTAFMNQIDEINKREKS
jgi:hypothetical protein